MDSIVDWFDLVAGRAARITGSAWAFLCAVAVIVGWLGSGPLFAYSDTWQLVINTSTTIVTFLMVFLIQHAQNKDARVVHMKLNELIAAMEGASNRLIDVEALSDHELDHLYRRFERLARDAQQLGAGVRLTVEREPE